MLLKITIKDTKITKQTGMSLESIINEVAISLVNKVREESEEELLLEYEYFRIKDSSLDDLNVYDLYFSTEKNDAVVNSFTDVAHYLVTASLKDLSVEFSEVMIEVEDNGFIDQEKSQEQIEIEIEENYPDLVTTTLDNKNYLTEWGRLYGN